MARSISDEEIKLRGKARRRLVGAIALVVIVAAFLPMVLDNKPKPVKQDIAIDIPKMTSSGFTAPIVSPPTPSDGAAPAPLAGVTPSAPAPPSKPSAAAVSPAANEPAQSKPAPKPEAKSASKPDTVADKPGAKASAAHGAKETFAVQLGAFSKAANAKQLQAKLNESGIKSFTDMLKTPSGEKTRVRAGPYASREEAEKVQEKLKKMGLKGNVVSAN